MGVGRVTAVLLLALAATAAAANSTADANVDTKVVTKVGAKANNKVEAKDDNTLYDGYDDYDLAEEPEEIMFNEDKPCPRDCVCERTQGYRIAKCNRLELGTQKFGEDITDLIVEHIDPSMEMILEDEMFRKLGLHQVSTIKIVNTTITYVSPTAFRGLQELYAVTLTANKLGSLHPETFAYNRKLILLTLSENPLKFPPKGSNDYFLNSTSVQELDISNCNMRYIAKETFSEVRSLMYLNVAGNELSNVHNDAFRCLLDLEELDLSDNNLADIPRDIFSNNTELATLHIQRNPIETVYGLEIPDIVTLNAGQTKIKFVGPSMFNGLTYISNLNLSGNGIEKIHNQAFHKLRDLNYLDLSYNNLDFVSSLLIEQNNELDILKISNNPRLTHLPKSGFNCSAGQFNIYLFDAAYCGLVEISDDALSTFPVLTQINLSGNKLQSIGDGVFAKLTRLVEVNLAYNQLTALSKKMFAQNKDMSKLNLRGNPLKVLSSEVFMFTTKLTWLDVSQTGLTTLWAEQEARPATLLNSLLFLNISHNNIAEIKPFEIESIKQLTTLDISYNPLACSRNFESLMAWVTKNKVTSAMKDRLVANMARDSTNEEDLFSWDALVKMTCGISDSSRFLTVKTTTAAPSTSAASASDEEIWEKIEDVESKDLKHDLDKVAKPAKEIDNADDIDGEDNLDDKLDGNDDDRLDDDDDDDEDEDDDDDEDDADDDEWADGDDMNLKIKLIDDVKPAKSTPAPIDSVEDDDIEMRVRLLDAEETLAALADAETRVIGLYDYIWPMLIVVVTVLVVLLLIGKVMMMVCARRSREERYHSAIITAMSHMGRTKKDCGLVYKQLSEDLVGPRTPSLSRFGPLPALHRASNVSLDLESRPLKSGVAPEAV